MSDPHAAPTGDLRPTRRVHTMTVNLTPEDVAALNEIAAQKDIRPEDVLRQAFKEWQSASVLAARAEALASAQPAAKKLSDDLMKVAAQLSTERLQGWSNPLVLTIASAAEWIANEPAQPAAVAGDALRESLRAQLLAEFSGAYDCTRVWEAWSVGTMGEDDFVPLSERVDEITDAILALVAPQVDAALERAAEVGDAMRKAAWDADATLEWYREQADAMMRASVAENTDAMMAIVTALSIDGGQRAVRAMSAIRDAELRKSATVEAALPPAADAVAKEQPQ